MTGSCGPSRRCSVVDYVKAPRLRTSEPLAHPYGERVYLANGVGVRMAVDLVDSNIRGLTYESSTCTTLIAYAEVLGELVIGNSAREAARITPASLVAALEGVPASRQDRAIIALRALWSAVAVADQHIEESTAL